MLQMPMLLFLRLATRIDIYKTNTGINPGGFLGMDVLVCIASTKAALAYPSIVKLCRPTHGYTCRTIF